MATVYSELGSQVTIVELMDQIIPGADKDVVAPLAKRITSQYENVFLKTKLTGAEAGPDGITVHLDGPKAPATDVVDAVLVAVGRRLRSVQVHGDAVGSGLRTGQLGLEEDVLVLAGDPFGQWGHHLSLIHI